ncbi:hypothetical protein [Candidatus Nitrosotenuis aquarius]|uniref:hypothetical protein n=1 Tax=Candidatus Nitrosotenuis aquarius TaxID=1846278 RepID=UPI001C465EFB|nr:hypothetical protein [Candidatus Nitrosotenuis aquarius]
MKKEQKMHILKETTVFSTSIHASAIHVLEKHTLIILAFTKMLIGLLLAGSKIKKPTP